MIQDLRDVNEQLVVIVRIVIAKHFRRSYRFVDNNGFRYTQRALVVTFDSIGVKSEFC